MTKTKLAKHEVKQVGIGKVVKALQEGKGAKRLHWKGDSCIRLYEEVSVDDICSGRMTKPFIFMSFDGERAATPLLNEDILAFDWIIIP